jgi:predicted neutral ceramidase superfamily lipid hydrolase
MRTLIAIVASLAGAAAVVYSMFQPWYRDRLGRQIPLSDLWNGITTTTTDMISSLFVPIVISAALVLFGLIVGRRWVMAIGTLIAVAVFATFLGQQLNSTEALASQFRQGFWDAAGGWLLMLIGSISRRPNPKTTT